MENEMKSTRMATLLKVRHCPVFISAPMALEERGSMLFLLIKTHHSRQPKAPWLGNELQRLLVTLAPGIHGYW